MTIKHLLLFATLLLLLAATACQAAGVPTATEAVAGQPNQPAQAPLATQSLEDYPSPEQVQEQVENYPAPGTEDPSLTQLENYPAPGMAPAVENSGKVTARLSAQNPDADDASYTRVTAEILSAEPIGDSPDFISKLEGQTTDLYVLTADLPALKAGDTFEAEVNYTGDEQGGKYIAKQVTKTE